MLVIPIKTRAFLPPKDDILPTLEKISTRLRDGDVLVVTSKIVAIGEGRCVKATTKEDKQKLIEQESESRPLSRFQDLMFSIKGNTIIASAGIDDSNGNGYSVLWPKDPMQSAKKIWSFLRKKTGIKNLGIVISDSYCTPLRAGVMGVSIGFYGFHPVANHIGTKDIFGRVFRFSKSNIADSVATSGVLVMGETSEQMPMAIVRNAPHLVFTTSDTRKELLIDPKKDIYYPMLKPFYDEKRR